MIRIGGGALRGRGVRVCDAAGSRPSSARLREALFDVLGDRVAKAEVADLFAGSGLLGLEALSRGASRAVFVEIDPRAVRVIHQNLTTLGLGPERAVVHRGDARRWMRRWQRAGRAPDVVLLDPPYREGEPGRLLPPLARLVESGAAAVVGIEHPASEPIDPPGPHARLRIRTRIYGRSAFTLIERSTP
jgi:16S rRNA (guanine966-N2)-methyltransferase